jgi:hypothetical protein
MKHITPDMASAKLQRIRKWMADVSITVDAADEDFSTAADLQMTWGLGLRAGDALHLDPFRF